MNKYVNYDLTEEQWKRIQSLLPPEYTGKKGRPRKDKPDGAERYAMDKSQWNAMETASAAVWTLAKRLCPFCQVEG